MTLRQEANQMINVMPEDTLRILVELMQKMVPQSNAAQAVKGNISQYYGSMQIGNGRSLEELYGADADTGFEIPDN